MYVKSVAVLCKGEYSVKYSTKQLTCSVFMQKYVHILFVLYSLVLCMSFFYSP